MTRKYTKRAKPIVETIAVKEPVIEVIIAENGSVTAKDLSTGEPVEASIEYPKEESVGNVNNCEYKLTMIFNGETFECYTNNLKISILSFAREVLTEMYVKIIKGQSEFEKRLSLVQGKKLLVNEQSLDIFLETFYGLYGQPTKLKT